MKQILKATIRPLFLGALFYLFILLANNSHWVEKDAIKTWTAIITGALFMYLIIYAAIYDRKNMNIAGIGFSIVGLVVTLSIPIYMVVNQLFFIDHSKQPTQTYFEKNNIVFVINPNECQIIKYGTFVHGFDTIIRYSENNKDYEMKKVFGAEPELHRIKWMDSCSYFRLNKDSSVLESISLGNFDGENHQMYIRPMNANSLENENIKNLTIIKE